MDPLGYAAFTSALLDAPRYAVYVSTSNAIDAARFLSRSGRYAAEVTGYASGSATRASTGASPDGEYL
jgi:hypothetical protein